MQTDGMVRISQVEENVLLLVYKCNIIFKIFNMKISTEKTTTTTILKEPVRCNIVIVDNIAEQVTNIKYLGIQPYRNSYLTL